MDKEKIEEAILKEKRDYFKMWRSKNKDKVKKHNKDYWERKAKKSLKKEQE